MFQWKTRRDVDSLNMSDKIIDPPNTYYCFKNKWKYSSRVKTMSKGWMRQCGSGLLCLFYNINIFSIVKGGLKSHTTKRLASIWHQNLLCYNVLIWFYDVNDTIKLRESTVSLEGCQCLKIVRSSLKMSIKSIN